MVNHVDLPVSNTVFIRGGPCVVAKVPGCKSPGIIRRLSRGCCTLLIISVFGRLT